MLDFSKIKCIHCIGIGGIGLSAVAGILLSRGYTVTGSDMNQGDKVHLAGSSCQKCARCRSGDLFLSGFQRQSRTLRG